MRRGFRDPLQRQEVQMINRMVISLSLFACFCSNLLGQVPLEISDAELAIPFGSVEGRLILVEDYLVFLDKDRQQNSFAVSKTQIREAQVRDQTVVILLLRPLFVESEAKAQLTLRLDSSERAKTLTEWARISASVPSPGGRAEVQPEVVGSYQVQHNHRPFGSCSGRLIVTTNKVAYESIDNISHSRQWELQDIKELERGNPYQLEIKPFAGNDYRFQFVGDSMDNREYKDLVERVTQARATR
jgi:hypothetical protein